MARAGDRWGTIDHHAGLTASRVLDLVREALQVTGAVMWTDTPRDPFACAIHRQARFASGLVDQTTPAAPTPTQGQRSYLALPLDQRPQAAVLCVLDHRRRDWTAHERQIAVRAATALSAILEPTIAATAAEPDAHLTDRDALLLRLQAGLLPVRLPTRDDLELATSFRPSGSAVLVGGDFYDVFARGRNELFAVVGDVCGKGPEAATVGATVRAVVRGAASQTTDVEALLQAVNADLLRQASDRFVTLAIAHIASGADDRRHVRIGVAGHQPPVLRRAHGDTQQLPCFGQLAGVFDEIRIGSATVVLEPGDALVFWTDGLTDNVERRDPTTRLSIADVLGATRPGSAAEIVTTLEDAAGILSQPDTDARDDITILAVRAASPSGVQSRPALEAPPIDPTQLSATQQYFRTCNLEVDRGCPPTSPVLGLLCECGRRSCRQTLTVGRADYEKACARTHEYIVIPGHQIAAVETVVDRGCNFLRVRAKSVAADTAETD